MEFLDISGTYINVEEKTKVECPICLSEIGDKNNCITPCGHTFCFSCLITCMSTNVNCPCCRNELSEKSISNDDGSSYDTEDDEEDNENEEDDGQAEIENIVDIFIKKGYTIYHALMIATNRFSKTNANYGDDFLDGLIDEFDEMLEELDGEGYEKILMTKEDINV